MAKKEKEKEELKYVYGSILLDESSIEYVINIINIKDNLLKFHLKAAKKYCNVPVKNIEDLRNQLRIPTFSE